MGKKEARERDQMERGACKEDRDPGRTGWLENWLAENKGQDQEKKGDHSGYQTYAPDVREYVAVSPGNSDRCWNGYLGSRLRSLLPSLRWRSRFGSVSGRKY